MVCKLVRPLLVVCLLINLSICEEQENKLQADDGVKNGVEFVGRMINEGRTLVHHTVKRFMVLVPVIFFKLGVAFTLLILVTIVAINNGFIGFLLLVVGLSSVLARYQEARRTPALPAYPYTPPLHPYYHQAHFLERSDSSVGKVTGYYSKPYAGYQISQT